MLYQQLMKSASKSYNLEELQGENSPSKSFLEEREIKRLFQEMKIQLKRPDHPVQIINKHF